MIRQHMYRQKCHHTQAGFTVVELMIATVVFAMVLLVISVGVLKFSSAYYKGANSSATQNNARSIMDTVSQAIQFGTPKVFPTNRVDSYRPGVAGTFCAGGYVFVYTPGILYTGAPPAIGNTGLLMIPMNGASCPDMGASAGANLTALLGIAGKKQLLSKNMRITNIQLLQIGTSSLYTLDLTLAYGDSDLLCVPSPPISGLGCGSVQGANEAAAAPELVGRPVVNCRPSAGSQFCAVSKFQTTVKKRVGS